MSKTFTSRPSQTYGRGRGANTNRSQNRQASPTRGRGMNERMEVRGGSFGATRARVGISERDPSAGQDPTPGAVSSPQQNSQELDQRMSYQGGFTMISPNEKKRQAIGEQARRGLNAYKAHKDQSRLAHVNYVGTVGGGEITEGEARQKAIDNQRTSRMKRLEKQHQYQEDKRKKEESENEQKKMQQRMKTERNASLQLQNQDMQRKKWDEDRKKKNEEFLKRFEHNSSTGGTTKKTSCSTGTSVQEAPQVLRGLAAPIGHVDTPAVENLRLNQLTSYQGDLPSSDDMASAFEEDEYDPDLQTLMTMFPQYEQNFLRDILKETGDADSAMQLLL